MLGGGFPHPPVPILSRSQSPFMPFLVLHSTGFLLFRQRHRGRMERSIKRWMDGWMDEHKNDSYVKGKIMPQAKLSTMSWFQDHRHHRCSINSMERADVQVLLTHPSSLTSSS